MVRCPVKTYYASGAAAVNGALGADLGTGAEIGGKNAAAPNNPPLCFLCWLLFKIETEGSIVGKSSSLRDLRDLL